MFAVIIILVLSLGLSYNVVMLGAGMRVMRRTGAWCGQHRLPPSTLRTPDSAGDVGAAQTSHRRLRMWWRRVSLPEGAVLHAVTLRPEDCLVYFLVPCLNEAAVIQDTVRGLLSDARARVVVIDDASEDDTGPLAATVNPDRVRVVRRELPFARQGKGPALNAGFAEILRDAASQQIATSRIIVCVMDADGRLSRRALDAVLPLFSDSRVGGAQLPVRIRDKGSLLTRLQDVEFWSNSAVSQLGRITCGTVSLGGNGQFTRLSALLGLGRDPWQQSLTEDLDLALALLVAGWRLESTAAAHVSQQGVTSLRALIRQRTRWFQGHMESAKWLRELWACRRLSHLGLLEVTMYLAIPWVLVLPWSIIFNYALFSVIESLATGGPAGEQLGTSLAERAAGLVLWYLISFFPNWAAGYIYYRQNRRAALIKSFGYGHLLLLANYVTYAACWHALYRLVSGRKSWDKTMRHAEVAGAAFPGRAGEAGGLPSASQAVLAVPAPRSPVAAQVAAAARHAAGQIHPDG